MKFYKIIIIALFLSSTLYSCLLGSKINVPTDIDFNKLPYENLSEYGFFKGQIDDLEPNESVLKYEPISTLFSDYSFKKRFVWMPKGSSANFDVSNQDAPFEFPDKTILVKNFYYPSDFSKPENSKDIMETRLFVKKNSKWNAYSYKWNAEQSEAKYKATGGIYDASWKDEQGQAHKIKYAMPNKNQCKSCHNRGGSFSPIGPKLKQLNHEISYNGEVKNQLDKWVEVGYLKSAPDKTKIINMVAMNDSKASIDLKARSYLDINCGHCHSKTGPAATSGLRMNFSEKDPYHWGVLKSPVAAGMGAGNLKYDINPGNSKESIIIYRMNSTHPGVMMPEIGRVSIHKEGVDLISKWIDGLEKTM